jgi:hypothetical protein
MTQINIKRLIKALREARPADDGSQKEQYATWYYTCEKIVQSIMDQDQAFDHADFLLKCQGIQ